jgi:carboxypeptidase Taq
MAEAYDELVGIWRRLHRLSHLQAIAGWDRAAMMPPKGSAARAEAMAEMDTLLHRIKTDAALGPLLQRAADEPLDEVAAANLREMRREWRSANALPERLVEEKALATARCEHAWQTQRPANDWAGFLENFRPVVRLAREEARWLAAASEMPLYDALLDQYEPGTSSAEVERVFVDLQGWLPGLVGRVRERQSTEAPVLPRGPFDLSRQRELSLEVMQLLGFDFEGRPARRERPSLQWRRSRGHAVDDPLPPRRFPPVADGHDPRDRPRAL